MCLCYVLQVNDIGITVLCTHLTADLVPFGLDYCTFHVPYTCLLPVMLVCIIILPSLSPVFKIHDKISQPSLLYILHNVKKA